MKKDSQRLGTKRSKTTIRVGLRVVGSNLTGEDSTHPIDPPWRDLTEKTEKLPRHRLARKSQKANRKKSGHASKESVRRNSLKDLREVIGGSSSTDPRSSFR